MKLELVNPIKLFKPSGEIEWQQEFAQIPFGYVSDDKLKVIFATRRKPDARGAFCSFPAEALFDLKDFSLLSLTSSPLLSLGGEGAFDQFGVMPGTVLRLNTGEEVMYYCGWSRSFPTPYRWNIGIAYKTNNGFYERKYMGPIIGQNIHHPYLTASPVVLPETNNGYEMFHLTGISWDLIDDNLESRYSITKSVSEDGISWSPSNFNLGNVRWDDECQTSPNILSIEGQRFMTFSYRSQTGFRYKLDRNYRTALAQEVKENEWCVIQKNIEVKENNLIRDDIAYLSTFVYQENLFALYNYSAGFGTSGIYHAKVNIVL